MKAEALAAAGKEKPKIGAKDAAAAVAAPLRPITHFELNFNGQAPSVVVRAVEAL